MTVSDATMTAAGRGLERLDAVARRLSRRGDEAGTRGTVELGAEVGSGSAVTPRGALERFAVRMDDDLDTPGATAELFDLVTTANTAADEGRDSDARALAAAVVEIAGALGLPLARPAADVDVEAAALAAERDDARSRRDYRRADEIRVQLQARGWIVEDGQQGTVIRR
jgi:cysteinyl-tRNA synthetase